MGAGRAEESSRKSADIERLKRLVRHKPYVPCAPK